MKRRIKDLKFKRAAKWTKYRSVKTTVNKISFASKHEAKIYGDLLLREKAGEIQNLRCQIPFDLAVNGEKICRYVSDFTFTENGAEVVVDAKSEYTKKLPVYRLKKKLMKACLNIEIKEF